GEATRSPVVAEKPPTLDATDSRNNKDADEEDDDKPKKKKEPKHAFRDEGGESDNDGTIDVSGSVPAQPIDVGSAERSYQSVELDGVVAESSVLGPRLRLTTSFAAGFARAARTNAGLAALAMRVE